MAAPGSINVHICKLCDHTLKFLYYGVSYCDKTCWDMTLTMRGNRPASTFDDNDYMQRPPMLARIKANGYTCYSFKDPSGPKMLFRVQRIYPHTKSALKQ